MRATVRRPLASVPSCRTTRKWYGSNLYPVCGGYSGYEQASTKLRCIESDEVAVAFGPPA